MSAQKSNENNNPWADRFNDLVQTCQSELKRTTQIGKKMLSATQSNAQLHDEYENLGRLVLKAINDKSIDWENEDASVIIESINKLEDDLKGFEEEVQDLKKE